AAVFRLLCRSCGGRLLGQQGSPRQPAAADRLDPVMGRADFAAWTLWQSMVMAQPLVRAMANSLAAAWQACQRPVQARRRDWSVAGSGSVPRFRLVRAYRPGAERSGAPCRSRGRLLAGQFRRDAGPGL